MITDRQQTDDSEVKRAASSHSTGSFVESFKGIMDAQKHNLIFQSKNSGTSSSTSCSTAARGSVMNLFGRTLQRNKKQSEEIKIKCNQCATECISGKHRFCYNCGHSLRIKKEESQQQMDKEQKKEIKRALISFIIKRYHLVSEYQHQCKEIDDKLMKFVEHKIKIEMDYIANNKGLLATFTEQQNENEYQSSSRLILSSWIDGIHETTIEHQGYVLLLQETLEYMHTENDAMIDFIQQFEDEHTERLTSLKAEWRENEIKRECEKIGDGLYQNKKKELWREWQTFLKKSMKAFHVFMKMRYRKIVEKSLSNMITTEMDIQSKAHSNYLSILNMKIDASAEIKRFLEFHKETKADTLDSLLGSLQLDTDDHETKEQEATIKQTIRTDTVQKDGSMRMSQIFKDTLIRTRSNGIEWFSPLIFSEKGAKSWNLSETEWNIVIFEQLLCETFAINRKWDKKTQLASYKPINYVRAQFEISKKKMNQLMNALMIDQTYNKYKLNSMCHRIEVLENVRLNDDFDGNQKEYLAFVHRQLSFILSCMVWYVLESNRKFWKVSGTKHSKSELMQSLHTNLKLVQDFCTQSKQSSNEQNAAFSPINHLMLMIQEIAAGLNDNDNDNDDMAMKVSKDVPVPNAIYQKIFILIMRNCFIEKKDDNFGDLDLDLGIDDDAGPSMPELYRQWTHIADLLFSLSKKTFFVSIRFHCFAFLELVFEKIIVAKDEAANPLALMRPDNNKKDRVLMKIIEETFCILMDDVADAQRKDFQKYQEDMYINKVIDKIIKKLELWLSNYTDCNSYTVAKFFIFYVLICKIKYRELHYVCYDKLIEFTLITATQMSNDLKYSYCGEYDEQILQTKLNKIENLNKFRVDFLRILHNQMRVHQSLDKHLRASIEKINTVRTKESDLKYVIIDKFDNNHTETFLLMWMSRFNSLVNDKLQHLKHQDINKDFLNMIDAIFKFIVITNQYKKFVSLNNKPKWFGALPPLNKVCVYKFKQWVSTDIEPIFSRCVDNIIEKETWAAHHSHSRGQKSELLKASTIMTRQINLDLHKRGSHSESEQSAHNSKYISDYIIDLCALTDSMTSGCLAFLSSLRLHSFDDSVSYWKVIQKQLFRVSKWIQSQNINKQISLLLPLTPILSRNFRLHKNARFTIFHHKKKKEDKNHYLFATGMTDDYNDEQQENMDQNSPKQSPKVSKKEHQRVVIKKLATQMHSLDFVLLSLDRTKKLIEEQYVKFINKEFQENAKEYLSREAVITLTDCNVSEFMKANFIFIPLKYNENTGCVVSTVKEEEIKHKYEIYGGFELVQIGEKKCTRSDFDLIMDHIKHIGNVNEMELRFKFNVNGAVECLFFGVYENYNQVLKEIASLISCEIIYSNLENDLFGRLYAEPIHKNRMSDLQITDKLFKICAPIFEFMNDKNFDLIIHDIFSNLMYVICFVLMQKTNNVKTKQWIKNDYNLIRDDVNELIKSFEDDIESSYIQQKCLRIMSIVDMIKFSFTHLTQHMLPKELQNYNAYCSHEHMLHECIVHPDKLRKFREQREEKDEKEVGIKLIKCRNCRLFINIKSRIDVIGYYFCGHWSCLKENVYYCGNCANKMMWKQNKKNHISKWDLMLMLNKKNDKQSNRFASKYVQNQCIRSQISKTFEQKEWEKDKKKRKKNRKKNDNSGGLP